MEFEHLEQHSVASNYPAALTRLLLDERYSADAIFKNTCLSLDILHPRQANVPVDQYLSLIGNAIELTSDPCLGLVLGREWGINAHGMVGFAAMSCVDFRDALTIASTYFRTRFPAMQMEFYEVVEKAHAYVELKEVMSLGQHKQFIVDSIFASFTNIARFLLGDQVSSIIVELERESPCNPQPYIDVYGRCVAFECLTNRMTIPLPLLSSRLRFFEPVTLETALRKCELLLGYLHRKQSLRLRILDLMHAEGRRFPTINSLADQLHMSPRTIRRKLRQENTSYQEILDQERKHLARKLLLETTLPLTDISNELQFSDSSYFTRAFRKWTGSSPSEYRRKHSVTV